MEKNINIKIGGVDQVKSLNDVLKLSTKSLEDMKAKQVALRSAFNSGIDLTNEELEELLKQQNNLTNAISLTEQETKKLGAANKETAKSFDLSAIAVTGFNNAAGEIAGTFSESNEEAAKFEENLAGIGETWDKTNEGAEKAQELLGKVFETGSDGAKKTGDEIESTGKKTGVLTTITNLFGKAAKLAFIGSGIGILVLGIAGLVAYFKSSQEGADKLSKIMGGLNGIFTGLSKLLIPVGENIVKIFENPKQSIIDLGNLIKENVVNRFVGLKDLFKAIADGDIKAITNATLKIGTGVDDVIGKTENLVNETKNIVTELGKQYTIGEDIAKQKIRLAELEITNNKLTKENLAEREKLRNVIDNEASTFEQKLSASKQIIALAKQEFERQQGIYKIKIDIAKAEAAQNGNLREDLQKIGELEAELQEKREEFFGVNSEQIAVSSALEKERTEATLALEKDLRDSKVRLLEDYYEQQKQGLENAAKDRIADIEKSVGDEQKKADLIKIIGEELNQQLSNLNKARLKERQLVLDEIAAYEISLITNIQEKNLKSIELKRQQDIKAAEDSIKDLESLNKKKELINSKAAKDSLDIVTETQNKASEELQKSLEYEKKLELASKELTEKEKFEIEKEYQKKIFDQRLKSADDLRKAENDQLEKSLKDKTISEADAAKIRAGIEEKYGKTVKGIQQDITLTNAENSKTREQIAREETQKAIDNVSAIADAVGQVSEQYFSRQQAIIEANIESFDKQLEKIEKEREKAEAEISAIDERLNETNSNIASLQETLAQSKGGISLQIQEQLESETKKQAELNKEKQTARKRVAELKKEEEANLKSKLEAEKKLEESRKRQAKADALLAVIQAQLAIASIAASSAKQDFTFGIATGAAVLALLGTLLAAKDQLKGFNNGGLVTLSGKRIGSNDGIARNFSNGDNMIASVKYGEVILNEEQQQKLGGDATFARIGVPGFANGGLVGSSITEATGNSTPINLQTNNVIEDRLILLNENITKLSNRPVITTITDINDATGRFETQQNRAIAF